MESLRFEKEERKRRKAEQRTKHKYGGQTSAAPQATHTPLLTIEVPPTLVPQKAIEPEKREHQEGKAPLTEQVPVRRSILYLTQVYHQQELVEVPIEEVKRSPQREQQERRDEPPHQTQEEMKEMLKNMS